MSTGGTSADRHPTRRTTKRRSSLRFEMLNAFVDAGMKGLSPSEIVVWLILYRDTKPGGTARTAVDDMARRGGLGRRTVLRALAGLEHKRMLRVEHRGGLNRGPSRYVVFPFPAPESWG
jgi:hypothetical protein